MGATALLWGCEGRNGCSVPVGLPADARMQPSMRWASAQPGLPVGRKYNQPMPALAKVTLAQRREIRRRRAAAESLLSIGRLLGLPHQTVSRIDRQERALQAEREAEAVAEQEALGDDYALATTSRTSTLSTVTVSGATWPPRTISAAA
jgi:hypothetical protein